MTTHAMIDLETAGVGNSAGIVQCGIVAFDPEGAAGSFIPGAEQEWNINLMSSLMHGGEVDPDTIDWWRKRRGQWDALTQGACTIPHLLDSLDAFWYRFRPERVWCHGATFDVPILAGYYARLGRQTPWGYSSARDTRTLFELADTQTGWTRPVRDTAHLGLADAKDQAEDVQSALASLRVATNAWENRLA